MKKVKIAVIGLKGLPAHGGAATVGEHLIACLKNDFEFTVYSVSSHTAAKTGIINGYRQIVLKQSPIKSLNTFYYFFRSLLHVLFIEKYDLVHLHHYSSGFIMPFLRVRYRVVVTFHGIYRHGNPDVKFNKLTNWLLGLSQRLNIIFASSLVSVSAPDAEYLEKHLKAVVSVIPNGVDLPSIVAHKQNEKYIVFAAGRIYDIKGLHLLLEALHINKDLRKLIVIGSLDHIAAYKKKIRDLSQGLNVIFIPLITEKEKLFELIAGAEFFVFPSLTEAMSMMLLEVAALHVPVIASDIQANTSIFDDSEVLFFRSGSSLSLAQQIDYAWNNMNLLDLKAQKAFEKVKIKYNWTNISELYHKIYLNMFHQ